MRNLTGLVEECRTERPFSRIVVTKLKIFSFGDTVEILDMRIQGRHRMDKGEMVEVNYETYIGIHWISHYDVLDENGDVKYSGVSD